MFELVLVLAFVMVGVGEMSFALVMAGVLGMGLREQGVMGCFLVSAFLKMLGGFVVMLGRGLVMMGGGQMVFGGGFGMRHGDSPSRRLIRRPCACFSAP